MPEMDKLNTNSFQELSKEVKIIMNALSEISDITSLILEEIKTQLINTNTSKKNLRN